MSVEYSALAAKLKAMYSRFLTAQDYEALLAKKSVNDICAYLKSTADYGDALSEVNERNVHRGEIELLLEQDMMDEYVRLFSFVDKDKRDLIEFWFVSREVEFLKREIQYIYTHETRSKDEINQSRFNAFFETHTKIKRDVMMNAASLSDCIEACAETPYAEILQRAQNLELDLFSIGMLLDSSVYLRAWKTAKKKLSGEQLKLLQTLLGERVDMLNLMWIYRGMKYFNFSSEIIFTSLIPIRHRITEDALKQLVNSEGAERFTEMASKLTPYGEVFSGVDEGVFPEENYRRIYNRLSKRIFVNNSESLAAVYAYLNLKEVEINNITTIIEGIRYNLNINYIRSHIGL